MATTVEPIESFEKSDMTEVMHCRLFLSFDQSDYTVWDGFNQRITLSESTKSVHIHENIFFVKPKASNLNFKSKTSFLSNNSDAF